MAGRFFQSLTSIVSDAVKAALPGSSPYEVQEINHNQTSSYTVSCVEGSLTLYRDKNGFVAVLYRPEVHSKAFILFKVNTDTEAMTLFSSFSSKLQPLWLTSRRVVQKEMLQCLCDTLRTNPGWSCAHLAAHAGLTECFKDNIISQKIESVCEVTQVRPIHIAVQAENLECIQELLVCKAHTAMADYNGDNVFHFAARAKNSQIIQMLASRDPAAINQLNMVGESALHVASLANKPDNVEQLLRWGADANLTMSGRYPIHCAMKAGSAKCAETLCKWQRGSASLQNQLKVKDRQYGGTPLHWAQNQECVYLLAELKCDIDAVNDKNETALHIMVRKKRQECVMALLSRGADATIPSVDGDTALHHAIQTDNIEMVKSLLVFGADVNARNKSSISPRHLAATSSQPSGGKILYVLHRVGATRCVMGAAGCNSGCSVEGSHDGIPPENVVTPEVSHKAMYDTIVSDMAMTAALTRSASASGSSILADVDVGDGACSSSVGDRVLCLDGGGIRGLILIQLLLAIEKATGCAIKDCFDWIAGTSTGGILALALVYNKPVRYCQGMYFRLKDEVFTGKRPYDTTPLEKMMKKEFGEHNRMSEIEHPKVLVTGVLADRHPAELHFFRNYETPGSDYVHMKSLSAFEMPDRPTEQYVWKAARSSGAAPTFFRAMGRFLDGGLMANNPTLDALTEIHEYNMGLRATNEEKKVRSMHVVVSLGTGRIPIKPVSSCDVYRPEGLWDLYKVAFGATALGQMLVDQATQAEGRPVERAKAWCSMIDVPFFRFSPHISEDVPLDVTDDSVLVNMLWETQCYIYEQRSSIEKLALILRPQ